MQHDLRPRVLILASHLPLTNWNESISLFMLFYRGRKNLAVEQYSSHMFMETRHTILQLPLKPVNLEYQQIVHSDDKQHINYHCSIVTKNIQVVLHRRHKHSSQWMYIAIILFSKLKCKTSKLFHRKVEGKHMLHYNWCHLYPAFHIILC